jgi:hypothetical protein
VTRLFAHRRPLFVLVIASVVIVAGLVVAGLQTVQVRTYSLRQPNLEPVASVRPGHPACEGPVTARAASRGVALFGSAASGSPTITVRVSSASRTVATGELAHAGASAENDVAVDHPIPAGRPLHVCVSAAGGVFSLMGAGSQFAGVLTSGVAHDTQFSLVLTRPATFLGSLPTAFSRASVFKPSWVGAWTFWLLLAVLACAVALAGVAVVGALEEDEADESSRASSRSS